MSIVIKIGLIINRDLSKYLLLYILFAKHYICIVRIGMSMPFNDEGFFYGLLLLFNLINIDSVGINEAGFTKTIFT